MDYLGRNNYGSKHFPTTICLRPGGDIELNTEDPEMCEAASASRWKKVIALTASDIFGGQLCLSCVSSAPRWLLDRAFESFKSEERQARNPNVVAQRIGDALGRTWMSLLC